MVLLELLFFRRLILRSDILIDNIIWLDINFWIFYEQISSGWLSWRYCLCRTRILISHITRERLKHFGKKGETYDQLINQLLDYQKQNLIRHIQGEPIEAK